MATGPNPPPSPVPATPPPPPFEEAPRFRDGAVPEAPPRPRGLLLFGLLALIIAGVVLLRTLSRGTPFLLVGGIYFPAWFSAGVIGAALATVTVVALRSFAVTRATGTGLIFLNCTIIYAFLAWLLLFA